MEKLRIWVLLHPKRDFRKEILQGFGAISTTPIGNPDKPPAIAINFKIMTETPIRVKRRTTVVERQDLHMDIEGWYR